MGFVIDQYRCIRCGSCKPACPAGAILCRDGEYRVEAGLCTGCGRCAGRCLGRAIRPVWEGPERFE